MVFYSYDRFLTDILTVNVRDWHLADNSAALAFVRDWHIAAFAAPQKVWSLLGVQWTLQLS